ncbi:PHD finger domain-containing protein, partial [Chitinophaga agrisoli]|uniref:PHD finger domain-containing protein n=1 Tax=Chitinophaga agrisoli TaxID=2607653 RepID=UPI001BC9B617
MFTFNSKPRFRSNTQLIKINCLKNKKSILVVLLILQAGDIEQNPGPKTKVNPQSQNERIIQCDSCCTWTHFSLFNLKKTFKNNKTTWICLNCGTHNLNSNLLQNRCIDTLNSFSVLGNSNNDIDLDLDKTSTPRHGAERSKNKTSQKVKSNH